MSTCHDKPRRGNESKGAHPLSHLQFFPQASDEKEIILLQMRYCPPGLPSLKRETDFTQLHIIIECEQAGVDLYLFNGSILIPAERMVQEPPSNNTPGSPVDGVRWKGRRNSHPAIAVGSPASAPQTKTGYG